MRKTTKIGNFCRLGNSKRISKKAQLTIFMIMGLALLIIFLIMYYTIGLSASPEQKQLQDTFSQAVESQPLNQYIPQCLESTLQQGLILLGKQGGVIYKDQGSIIPKRQLVQFEEDEVAFLIKKHPTISKKSYGRNALLFLTKDQGDLSIQEQLKQYVLTYTDECIDLTELQKLPELSAYEITKGDLNIEISFGANDVSSELNFQINIKSNDEQITKELSYSAKANVRFRKIYNAIEKIIQQDNSNLDYSTLDQFDLSDAEITKQEVEFNDIFIITDSKSTIRGEPFVFQFAVENRYPILDMNDINANEGDTITISPNAKDPDEDTITYTYESSWRPSEFNQQTPSFDLNDDDSGTHTIKITASDGQLQDSQEIEIHVS